MTGLIELCGARETSRTRADHCHPLFSSYHGRLWNHPPVFKSPINDNLFIIMDTDGRFVNAKHTACLAGSRADTASELREIVGMVETIKSLFPSSTKDEIVPFRNEVINGTPSSGTLDKCALMTERHTTVHAARPLFNRLKIFTQYRDLTPVLETLPHWTRRVGFTVEFEETSWFTHGIFSLQKYLLSKVGISDPCHHYCDCVTRAMFISTSLA